MVNKLPSPDLLRRITMNKNAYIENINSLFNNTDTYEKINEQNITTERQKFNKEAS